MGMTNLENFAAQESNKTWKAGNRVGRYVRKKQRCEGI